MNTIWEENTNSIQQPPKSEKQQMDCSCNQERYNTQETKYKNNHPGGSSGGLPDRKGKEDSMFYIFTPNRPGDRGKYERSPGAAPNTYDLAGRFERTQSTMGK